MNIFESFGLIPSIKHAKTGTEFETSQYLSPVAAIPFHMQRSDTNDVLLRTGDTTGERTLNCPTRIKNDVGKTTGTIRLSPDTHRTRPSARR